MSFSILTTSSINSLIENFRTAERNKLINPLDARKKRLTNLSSSYNTLSTKLASFLTTLNSLKQTGSDSLFASKSAVSSNDKILTAIASNSAVNGSFNARVLQLAKNDALVSSAFQKNDSFGAEGTHSFTIKTGDENGAVFYSSVDVELTDSETYATAMSKLRDAINSSKAVVKSEFVNGSENYTGGSSSIVVNLNGVETQINAGEAANYSELLDEIVNQINNISGITAKKVSDSNNPSNFRIELTVNDTSKYISISHLSGHNITDELGIGVDNLKSASGMVSASVFSPTSSNSQVTITARETGLDYRIREISDNSGSELLGLLNLNLGAERTEFNQSKNTAGYLFADITDANNLLNAKLNFNGISVQRNSNTIKDLVNGLTINLQSASAENEPDTNINVTADRAGIKSKIEEFISKFNDVYTYIRTKRSSSANNDRGVFHSDAQAAALLSFLSEAGYLQVSGLNSGDISYLAQIGITFKPLSGLSISDSTLLEQKILENTSQVETLFNSDSGIAASLYGKLNQYTGAEGFLTSSKNSLDNNILIINDRIDAAHKRINKSAEVLRKQYEVLQMQLASLLSVQNMFITGNSFF